MDVLTPIDTVTGGALGAPMTVARVSVDGTGSGDIVIVDSATGRRITLTLTGTGIGVRSADFPASGVNAVTFDIGPTDIVLGADDLADVLASGDSETLYHYRSGTSSDAVEVVAVDGDTVILAPADGGLYVFDVAGGTAVLRASQPAIAPLNGMSVVTVGNSTLMIGISAEDQSITTYRVATNGTLTAIQTLTPEQGLSINTPTDIQTVTINGTTFAIVTAAESNSLTILKITESGVMTVTDHVIDDLNTRFDGALIVEVFQVDGKAFILTAGGDDGLSLFTLTPDGHLVHLQTVADTTGTTLDNISGLQVIQSGSGIQVLVMSQSEAGLTRFDLDPAALGNMGGTVGGAGNDILIDTAGATGLTGGAGADIFILTPDGATDTITDFTVGQDTLDLSAFGLVRDISSITVTPTSNGAILTVYGEDIVLISSNGAPITAAMLGTASIVNATHVPVIVAATPLPGDTVGTEGGDVLTAQAGGGVVWGFGGNDTLRPSDGADTFQGGAGTDVVDYGGAGAGVGIDLGSAGAATGAAAGDLFTEVEGIIGSAFADTLCGDGADNFLSGGEGADRICGRGGNDTLDGGGGRDRLEGGDGHDVLYAGGDHDEVLGQDGNDSLYGQDGNDTISASAGNDYVDGGLGNDSIGGGDGNDDLWGGAGHDIIGSGNDNDTIHAGDGDDVTSGGYGADIEYGGNGNDTMAGSYGDDLIYGEAGDDSLGGGTGKDTIYGGGGNDEIGAGSFDDLVYGGDGHDFLAGGEGADTMAGDAGNDTLNGGTGDDVLTGGAGADVFVFNEFTPAEVDTITDFQDGDLIRLKGVAGGYNGLILTAGTDGGQDYVDVSYDDHTIRVYGVDDLAADDFWFI